MTGSETGFDRVLIRRGEERFDEARIARVFNARRPERQPVAVLLAASEVRSAPDDDVRIVVVERSDALDLGTQRVEVVARTSTATVGDMRAHVVRVNCSAAPARVVASVRRGRRSPRRGLGRRRDRRLLRGARQRAGRSVLGSPGDDSVDEVVASAVGPVVVGEAEADEVVPMAAEHDLDHHSIVFGGLLSLDPLVGTGIGALGAVAWVRRRDRVLGATLVTVSVSWLAPAVVVGHVGTIFVHRALLVHAVRLRIPANGRQRPAWGALTSALLALLYVVNIWLPWADGLAAGATSVALLVALAARVNRRVVRVAVVAAGVMLAIGVGGRSASLFTAGERLAAYDVAAMLVAVLVVLDRFAAHHPDQVVEAGRSGRLVAGGVGASSRLTVGFEDGLGGFRSLSGERVEPSPDERHFRIDLGTDVGQVLVIHDDPKFDDPVVRIELEPGLRALALNVVLARQLQRQGVAAEVSRRRVLDADKRAHEAVASDVESGVVPHLDRISRILKLVELSDVQRADVAELVSSIRHEVVTLASGDDPLDFGAGLAANLRELTAASRIPVVLALSTDVVDYTACRALYLVASEALTNSAKHSSASQIRLSLRRARNMFVLSVEDDGRGGAAIRSGGGIDNARQRLHALGGELWVEAPPAGGARLTAWLPCGDRMSTG